MKQFVCLDCGEDEPGLFDGWVFIEFSDSGNRNETQQCPKCKKIWSIEGLCDWRELYK